MSGRGTPPPRTWISKTDKLVIESKKLSEEGKGKGALGKVEEAKNLVKRVGGVMVTFVQGSEAEGKKFVETWWAEKPDIGKLDKIKAFFSSSPEKDLEKALEIYKIKVREAETKTDKYVKEMQGLQPKFVDLSDKASKAKNKTAEQQAKKAWERFEYVSKKQSLLRKNLDDAKKVAESAAKLINEAKAGKYESFGGAALGKIGDAAPAIQDMVSIAMNAESLVKAIQ